MKLAAVLLTTLALGCEAFAPARVARGRVAPLSMSAESRLLSVVAETRLATKLADAGVLSKLSGSISLADLEGVVVDLDKKGLLDLAVGVIESPAYGLAEGAVLIAGGESPFKNPFRQSVQLTKEDTASIVLRKVSDKKLLSLVAKKGILSKADAAGLTLADLEPLLKAADELGVVSLLAQNVDDLGPFLVDFAPRALPLAGGLLSLAGGPPKISAPSLPAAPKISAPSIQLPSVPAPKAKATAPAPKKAKATPPPRAKKAAAPPARGAKAEGKAAPAPKTKSVFGATFEAKGTPAKGKATTPAKGGRASRATTTKGKAVARK